ncbi:endonuclease/exonuclease/phosphatase family protein [Blastopirellula marina]|uniref:Endonuclease n=1 Tax=Blastopirellula marina TaxID=124 RepID=A0A2S8FPK1_9BACT|nr:endonuclease/exonuclease/phosphatase family protein [Blastopirellula marina]PQO33794.1 endonuclease [Blastopirellula marina]PTL43581.1 endonuclease [Blastopirellula marina]
MLKKLVPALSLLVALVPLVLQAAEPVRVRVVSYNIHHAEGTDAKLNLPRIAKVIAAANPDIVALQEVDQKVKRTGQVDQVAELAKLTKMNSVFGGNIPLQGGWYGNAVMTRYASLSMTNHPLPQLGPGEKRGVIEADITIPGLDQPLKFLATHFDHHRDDAERIASAKKIQKLAEGWKDRPALFAGDLNATPESESIKLITQDWTSANQKNLNTIPSQKPNRQIDYILYRPASGWKVIEFQVLDEPVASDHRGILAVLEWTGNANH